MIPYTIVVNITSFTHILHFNTTGCVQEETGNAFISEFHHMQQHTTDKASVHGNFNESPSKQKRTTLCTLSAEIIHVYAPFE